MEIYLLQFPKRMLNESELNDLKVSESDAHLEGMKRYSEFLSLHNKLLKSSSYARHIKGNRISRCFSSSHFPLVVQHTVHYTCMLFSVIVLTSCSLSVFILVLQYTQTLNRFGTARPREGLQPCIQASVY